MDIIAPPRIRLHSFAQRIGVVRVDDNGDPNTICQGFRDFFTVYLRAVWRKRLARSVTKGEDGRSRFEHMDRLALSHRHLQFIVGDEKLTDDSVLLEPFVALQEREAGSQGESGELAVSCTQPGVGGERGPRSLELYLFPHKDIV